MPIGVHGNMSSTVDELVTGNKVACYGVDPSHLMFRFGLFS